MLTLKDTFTDKMSLANDVLPYRLAVAVGEPHAENDGEENGEDNDDDGDAPPHEGWRNFTDDAAHLLGAQFYAAMSVFCFHINFLILIGSSRGRSMHLSWR